MTSTYAKITGCLLQDSGHLEPLQVDCSGNTGAESAWLARRLDNRPPSQRTWPFRATTQIGSRDRRGGRFNKCSIKYDLRTCDSPSLATRGLLHEQAGAGMDPALWWPAARLRLTLQFSWCLFKWQVSGSLRHTTSAPTYELRQPA